MSSGHYKPYDITERKGKNNVVFKMILFRGQVFLIFFLKIDFDFVVIFSEVHL